MRGYWENKSCSCCAPNMSLAQTEQRRYLRHVAGRGQTASCSFESEIQPPWQKAGLAVVMPDACALAKLRAWVVNTRRAKGCSFTKQQRVAWTSVCCTVPSRWLTYRALAKSLPHLLRAGRHAGRLLFSLHHLCLHCSPRTQRVAGKMGRTSPICPLPLPHPDSFGLSYCQSTSGQILL